MSDHPKFEAFKAERLKNPEIKAAYDEAVARNDLAAILAKHRIEEMSTWRKQWRCTCGEKIGKSEEPAFLLRSTHRAHVAQMVLESDWLRERYDEKWREGRRSHAHRSPYRADRVDAEDGGR